MEQWSDAELAALVADATVDAYDKDEQLACLYTMIEDNLAMPFETGVLGMPVTVEQVRLSDAGHVVAVCRRDDMRQEIGLLELPLPTPPPKGAEWIAAYRSWATS